MPIKSAGAPPNNSASGPTKPIDPPQPMATGLRSKPACIAVNAASKAGPLGSVIHQLTGAPIGFTVTLTPHGGSAVRKLVNTFSTSSGSWSGTIRQLTIADAFGNT